MINLNAKTRINPEELIWIEGHVNYSKLYLANQSTLFLAITLKKVLEKLDECQFVRIHRSQVVNINYLGAFKVTFNSISFNNKTIPIARRRRAYVQSKLNDMVAT